MSEQWPLKPLSEICEIRPAKSEVKGKFESTELVSFVPMKYLGIEQMTIDHSETREFGKVYPNYTYFADGDVLLAKITPCFENGKLGIAQNLVNGIGFGSSEYIVFRPNKDVCKEWIYYFLSQKRFRIEGERRMLGSVGQKRVSKDFIADYKIPVPPLEEQQRIVSILDEAFEQIGNRITQAEHNVRTALELNSSRRDSTYSDLLANNECVELNDLCYFENGDRGKNYPSRSTYTETGIPMISAAHLGDSGLDMAKMNFIPRKRFELLRSGHVANGDILYCLRGSLGKCAIVKGIEEGAIASSLVIVRTQEKLNNQYLLNYLKSSHGKALIYKYSNGMAQPNLSAKSLRKFIIPLVSNQEQTKIANELHELKMRTSELSTSYLNILQNLGHLKQSILQDAFTGKLTGGIAT